MHAHCALPAATVLVALIANHYNVPLTLTAQSLPWRPWTLITYVSISSSYLAVPATLLFFFSSRYLERIWGSKVLVQYWLISTAVIATLLFCLTWAHVLLYQLVNSSASTSNLSNNIWGEYYGIDGYLTGVLVAYKQAIPEQHLPFSPLAIRVKHLPFTFVIVHLTCCSLGILHSYFTSERTSLVVLGLFISWWYLRFVNIMHGIRGDRGETFAFVMFFPDQIQHLLRPAIDAIYKLAITLNLVRPASLDLELASRSFRPATVRNSRGITVRGKSSASTYKTVVPAVPTRTASPASSTCSFVSPPGIAPLSTTLAGSTTSKSFTTSPPVLHSQQSLKNLDRRQLRCSFIHFHSLLISNSSHWMVTFREFQSRTVDKKPTQNSREIR